MPVQLAHASVLMSEHARLAQVALLVVVVHSAVLLLECVTIGGLSLGSELSLVMGIHTFIIATPGCVDPKLANLSLPFALMVRDEVSFVCVIAFRGRVRLGTERDLLLGDLVHSA